MSVISQVSSLAKQRQKRPGAKRILSRLRACRPTPVKRVIHHLHPDGHIGTRVASLRHRRAPKGALGDLVTAAAKKLGEEAAAGVIALV
jgi:hypothetical protein